jgi:hypothetical protein
VFDTYWRFAHERQRIFFRRLLGQPRPWTADWILESYRFTNVYRASDRVSQYLIGKVIPGSYACSEDVFFRTILFKIFNRIDTWERLTDSVDEPHVDSFNIDRYAQALNAIHARGGKLYSAAYIMPSPPFGLSRKHLNHLSLLKMMLDAELPRRLADARTMSEAYLLFLNFPSIGPFLAFQYVIDANYSELLNFSEQDFVIAGPGAIDGISKCFTDTDCLSSEGVIRAMAEMAEQQFERLALPFLSLWGRPLQLIDCQNLFCEVAKYSRLAHPTVQGSLGRARIKQTYHLDPKPIEWQFPSRWGLDPTPVWEPLASLDRRDVLNVSSGQIAMQSAAIVRSQQAEHTTPGDNCSLPLLW